MLLRGGRRVCYIGRMETYLTLLLLGTALFVLEIFVPGGIAGLFGGLLCLLAAWKAVASFDGWIGLALALLAVVVACGMVFLVVRVFPSTRVGKKLSLDTDLKESRADDQSHAAPLPPGSAPRPHSTRKRVPSG